MSETVETPCPCCAGAGVLRGTVEPFPGPNRALQDAFALIAANLEIRAAKRRYEEDPELDQSEWEQAVETFHDLAASVLRETPGGTLTELAHLAGTAFDRPGAGAGMSGKSVLSGIAAMYSSRDWQGGLGFMEGHPESPG